MAKKEKNERLSEIALKPVEISAELPEKDNVGKKLGLKIARRFTKPGENVFDTVQWDKRTTTISDEKGNVISQITDVEVPTTWTQLATDILAYKYLRKAGVPTKEGREVSLKQAVYRIAHTIADFGEKFDYFATEEDRVNFEEDLTHILVNQKAAFNSPVWFNCGLYHQYKIAGSGGSFYWDFQQEKVIETKDSYRNPQCSACFILSVEDSLDGIFNLLKTESRVFKFGSGTGANYSRLRSKYERLNGGGTSSGMMSFLKVFDRAADSVKSGGTTRRAAKMVVVDMSHPEIEDFINWKVKEEKKVLALIEAGYSSDFNGEAYHTVSGQNSNNSVRITDEFMEAVANDGEWTTRYVGNGEPHKTYKARDLMDQVAKAAWQCADPGVQFDTTINKWHTVPNTGRINASNPCSEYLHLDDSACVGAETRISTPNGQRTVADLFKQQESGQAVHVTTDIYSEHDHRRITAHRPALVTKVGEREVFRINLKDGRSIRATADHRFLTEGGEWKCVDKLTVGTDQLQIRESGNPISFSAPEKEVNRWRLLGWLTGDGVFSRGNVALVFGQNEGDTAKMMTEEFNLLIKESYKYDADKYGLEDDRSSSSWNLVNPGISTKTQTIATSPRLCHISSQSNGVLQVTSKARPLVSYLERYYGIKQNTALNKNVPRAIHYVSDDLKVAYLQGLFSADGCMRKAYTEDEVMLTSSSPSLLSSVQLLLSDMGITSRITQHHPKGRKNPQGQLHIYNQQARRFLNLVSFTCSTPKNNRAQAILNRPFSGVQQNPRSPHIVSIRPDGVTTVFDITEPVTHSFIAEGLVTHNCNLASINLVKFTDDKGNFDVEGYRHACKIMFIAQEIEVDLSSYPTEAVTKNSHDYRPLGLGYANLGTMLMLKGVPYDSPEALATAGALSAIMTGHAYKTSAEMAAIKGAFEGFAKNRAPMLNVMKMHRQAAYAINETFCPNNLLVAARQDWDEAVALGEQFGYRNSQATVIAPTGTIGLLLDCDTTGIEPDFALVKFKKLAGGGSMKIVNNAVKQALQNLGYTQDQQQEIIDYALGVGRFIETTPINRSSLADKGLTSSEIDKVEKTLSTAFDISFSFNRMVLGDDIFTRLGISADEEKQPNFSLLGRLGFTADEVAKSNLVICGTQTVEGAPHLKEEHLPVFDCANRCGATGTRFIAPLAHVRMMAAVQPFISGAISKTINLPNEATLQDVEEVYAQSWKLGLKALALYRDGSKLSQPLNTKKDEVKGKTEVAEKVVEKVVYAPKRRRLPDERRSITHKFQIAGHKGFITVGLYEDGKAGEIFVTMAKQGSTISGLMDAFAKSVSIGIQYGVPLTMVVRQFANSRFEPYGFTTNPQIRIAKSIIDYIARYLGIKFLNPTDQAELGIRADADASSLQTQIDFNEPVVEQPIVDNGSQVDDQASPQLTPTEAEEKQVSSPNAQAQVDSPPCPNCGSITFKTGTCYTCMSCGSTTGGCS